ncbi:MAG: homoserine O-acetyltransferase [Fimbriimonadaceae bacterium]|nr:homoserine O-acetyltransferase [Fimbriimonadaceae bacterium]
MADDALFQENERTAPSNEGRQSVSIGDLPLRSGDVLTDVRVAFQTFGQLSSEKDNAILVCHALSGDANCAQWWERLVGPGKAIDTDRFFVVGTNALGGCQGTTGPASTASDGKAYGSRFPSVTVEDMVSAQDRVRQHLGIEKWALVTGGSMGGMQALEWAIQFPERVERVWMTASAARHSAMQIGFNEAARQAIRRDPGFMGGDYPLDTQPSGGLAVARMIGHLSYLSEDAFQAKFGRERREDGVLQVASYLSYQGEKFTHRFDANSLLVLSQAIDDYDPTHFSSVQASFLLTSFTSDWLYPSWQSVDLLRELRVCGARAEWHEIDLPYGHDAFLLDGEQQGSLVREFLRY